MKPVWILAALLLGLAVVSSAQPPRHRFGYGDTNRPTAFVNDYDVDFKDTTYGNVSASLHGFIPKYPNNTTTFFRGNGTYAQVSEGALSISDVTTANVSASAHGLIPKYPNNTTTFFRGDGTYATAGDTYTNTSTSVVSEIALFADTAGKLLKRATGTGFAKVTSGVLSAVASIVEGDLALTDIATANVSTSAHGFAPKLPGTTTTFLNGNGAYTTPTAIPGLRNMFGSIMQNVWIDIGTASSTIAGSVTLQIDATGWFNRWTSAASANAQAGLRLTGTQTWLDHNPDMNVRIRTPSDITLIRLWVGCFNGGTFPSSSDTPAGRSVGVRYSTSASDTSWVGFYTDTTPTIHLTSAIGSIAASTVYDIRVEVTGAGTNANYTINGVTASQSMTSATGAACAYAVFAVATTASARAIDWTRIWVQTN